MGVDRSDWILIGADIGMDCYDDDKYEDYDEYSWRTKSGEITYIIDGMSGNYFIVGEVVECAKDWDGLGMYTFESLSGYESTIERVKKFIREKFDIEVEPKLIILTHFS